MAKENKDKNMKDDKDKENKSDKNEGLLKLKVVEALQEDAYKGIARIDKNTMNSLSIKAGDVILIKGERETVAIADKAYPSDSGEQIIRIDGIIRKNAKTGVGEIVGVGKANLKEAKKITIAPAQQGIMVKGDPEGLKQNLLGRAFVKGDLLVMSARGQGGRRNQVPDELNDFFGGDIGEMLGGMFGGAMSGMNNPISQIRFAVVNLDPKQPCVITENTELTLSSKAVEISEDKIGIPEVTYEDIGGLDGEVKKIREMVELPLKHPEIFEKLGVEPPKGVLLYGPPGTGKTLLAKAVASESGVNFILINGPEIFNKYYGESEKKIREIFDNAEKNAPSIIFIDELDAIAPSRDSNLGSGEVEKRVVSQLLTVMDGLNARGKVVVIGASNRPEAIDPALRRPGRFDREVEINIPDKNGRLNILKIHTRSMPLAKDVNLEEFAKITHGFVGADLSALCKEAAMAVIRRLMPKIKLNENEEISPNLFEELKVAKKDFDDALKFVQPSALREVSVEIPNVKWDDVGGLYNVKKDLKEAVEWPLKYPDSFTRLGIRPPRGILIYGPPGTGKTMLAKAVATESEANFIQVNGPELQKEGIVGKETERLRKIFKRARQVAPCVVLFDEIDSFAKGRGGQGSYSESNEGLLNTLLTEMDGLEELKDVVIIGATNRPDMLDAALLRPGRFDRLVFVGSPNREEREAIFKVHAKNIPVEINKKEIDELNKKYKNDKPYVQKNRMISNLASDKAISQEDLDKLDKKQKKEIEFKDLSDKDKILFDLAEKAEGYSGADIEGVCREAAMLALREDINTKSVKKKDFDNALKKIGGSISPEDLKRYKEIESKYLRSARAALNKQSYTG